MAQDWFCRLDGQVLGPLTPSQLKQLASSGDLQPQDPVRHTATGKWVPAAQVKGLIIPGQQAPPAEAPISQPEKRQEILGVPHSVARDQCVFPLSQENGTLKLLAAEAGDDHRDMLAFILNTKVKLIPASEQDVLDRIDQYYSPTPPSPQTGGSHPSPATEAPSGRTREIVQTRLGVMEIVDLSGEPTSKPKPQGSFLFRLWRPIALSRFASRITAKVRDTHPSKPSGLYDHEPYIEEIGRRIHARYGLQGMQDVFNIVERRKGRGVTSELGRIWRVVEDWSY